MCRNRRSSPARGPALAPALAFAFLLALPPAPAGAAETITFSADSSHSVLASGRERTVLTGHARVDTDGRLISADTIELFGKDFTQAIARGNVRLVDAKRGIELTSDELAYDRDTKVARIRGNAVLADLKNEIVVKGGFIEDRDTEGLTLVEIGVRILKKDLVCRSEFAKYWRDRKLLELSGMPFVTRKGDEFRATRMTIDLDTEEITLEGSVQGTASSGEGGAPAAPAPAPAPPAPAPEAAPAPPPASSAPAATPPLAKAPVSPASPPP
jgi:lipopolysaccharide export system protein LptA